MCSIRAVCADVLEQNCVCVLMCSNRAVCARTELCVLEQSCVCSNRAVCARTELCVLEQSCVCSNRAVCARTYSEHATRSHTHTHIRTCYLATNSGIKSNNVGAHEQWVKIQQTLVLTNSGSKSSKRWCSRTVGQTAITNSDCHNESITHEQPSVPQQQPSVPQIILTEAAISTTAADIATTTAAICAAIYVTTATISVTAACVYDPHKTPEVQP